jgi:tRNA (mo5U34)-methyltransferase
MKGLSPEKLKLEIGSVADQARAFHTRLTEIKRTAPVDFEWYPHRSLTNFTHLDKLLTGANRLLLEKAKDMPVADIAAGDGDISYFLEQLGFRVHAFDHPVPNHNGMAGIRALHALLHSYIDIRTVDLDAQFNLGDQRYGLVFLLGVLYHLKNPFYVLEHLSKKAEYCVMSTRIARVFPRVGQVDDVPLAYLLEDRELNRDNSNFWIFSEACLRRLLRRTNWDVVEFITVGATQGSDATSLDKDERAFVLLKSRWALANVELLEGWYAPEDTGWRWTAPAFSVGVPPDQPTRLRVMRMHVFISDALLKENGPLTLNMAANGVKLGPEAFAKPGEYFIEKSLAKASEKAGGPMRLDFKVSKPFKPEGPSGRELGLIVASIEFE